MPSKNQENLIQILFAGSVAGFILATIFSISTSTSMKLITISGFMLIGLMVAFAFWRSLKRWI